MPLKARGDESNQSFFHVPFNHQRPRDRRRRGFAFPSSTEDRPRGSSTDLNAKRTDAIGGRTPSRGKSSGETITRQPDTNSTTTEPESDARLRGFITKASAWPGLAQAVADMVNSPRGLPDDLPIYTAIYRFKNLSLLADINRLSVRTCRNRNRSISIVARYRVGGRVAVKAVSQSREKDADNSQHF